MKYNPAIVIAYFRECGLPAPLLEAQFHAERKWRFDFCWHPQGVAIEVQGGIFINGGHNRGAALRKEHEKRNAAAALGWRILYVEPKDLCTAETVELVKECLK